MFFPVDVAWLQSVSSTLLVHGHRTVRASVNPNVSKKFEISKARKPAAKHGRGIVEMGFIAPSCLLSTSLCTIQLLSCLSGVIKRIRK